MPGVFPDHVSALACGLIDRARQGVVQVHADAGTSRLSTSQRGRGQERGPRGAGSGVVWDARQIITNHHVVGNLETVAIITSDDRRLEARVVRSEPRLDLALLELNQSLTPARVGDSSTLRVGEIVFALGHPWGQPWVATAGVVSGLGETMMPERGMPGPRGDPRGAGRPREWIRTDAQLRPGNSGGALLNARGEVIGVNAMVWHGDLGVAIPSQVVRGWLQSAPTSAAGFRLGVQLQAVALTHGLERSRALMVVGLEDGPASLAGLSIGDVLIEVNGKPVADGDDLLEALAQIAPDSRLELGVLRAGQSRTIRVATEEYARAA